jgi:N-acetylglucosamine-6-phosphate deacetylase
VNAPQLTPETVTDLVDAMLSRGVTCFAPTIITAPEDRICSALSMIAEARRSQPRVAACIPFVHLEGPHISPLDGYRRAHPADAVRPPSIAKFERWQHAAGGHVGMSMLRSATHILRPNKSSARSMRARLSAHIGNGIAPEIPRHRNPIWSQPADDRLTATCRGHGFAGAVHR